VRVPSYTPVVITWSIFGELSPYARVATATLPFALAIFVRLVLGNNQLTRGLLSISVLWFTANIVLAPFTVGIRQGIRNLLP
jgi:hypothetical protein